MGHPLAEITLRLAKGGDPTGKQYVPLTAQQRVLT